MMALEGVADWIISNLFQSLIFIFGIIITSAITFYVARNYSPKAEPVYQQMAFRIIEEQLNTLPKQIKIFYGEKNVPRLTKYHLIFWNRGHNNLDGSSMQPMDPLKLTFDQGSEIYEIKSISQLKSTIDLKWRVENNAVFITFNDLEPNEGFNLEILHTGSNGLPYISGSFRNIPTGPKNLGLILQWGKTQKITDYVTSAILLITGILSNYSSLKQEMTLTSLTVLIILDILIGWLLFEKYRRYRKLYPKILEIKKI